MLELDSPDWIGFRPAYGDATDVPSLFAELRAASSPDESDNADAELMNAVMHQGDVYAATYAIVPHLLKYASDLGPGQQSDELLCSSPMHHEDLGQMFPKNDWKTGRMLRTKRAT